MNNSISRNIDVCIIGAGPAGATTALQLDRLGIDCIIIDKAVFPRDKVCGDGLSGKVLTVLERIDPAIAGRLRAFEKKQESWGVDFVSPGGYTMHIPYKPGYDPSKDEPVGFVCPRKDFDNFLVNELRQCTHVQLIEGIAIEIYEKTAGGYLVRDQQSAVVIQCKALVVANGAHSDFLKQQGSTGSSREHYSAGVRAYFSGVAQLHQHHFIELHFLKELLPGYLWIFPLGNGRANVGLDMLSKDVSSNKINLRKLLLGLIKEDPALASRFENATMESKVEGYGLPLAGSKPAISGSNYLLVGDAASMIDPLTGEGIGNAMYAARIAAIHISKAINCNDYNAAFMKRYDTEVYRILGSEFTLSSRLQKLAGYPWLFNWLMKKGSTSLKLQSLVSSMLYDVNARKQLASPAFYLRLLFNK